MYNFRVGQRVVCVDGFRSNWTRGEATPKSGTVYTVRGVVHRTIGVGLLLAEIHNEPLLYSEGYVEIAFLTSRFRPVVERKTSIEVFKRMVNPSKQLMDA